MTDYDISKLQCLIGKLSVDDLNIQDMDGWTPLYNASYEGHTEIVQLLVDNGADPNIKDEDGRTLYIRHH